MLDRLVLILLGVWAGITGILLVTNLKVEWDRPLMGFAALVLGIVCVVRACR